MTRPPQHKIDPAAASIDWQQTLSEHRRWLATVLRARGVEATAVEEVWQEVATAAVANGDKLRDVEKVAPWLYRIAVVSALQYRRRMGRRRRLVERYRAAAPESLRPAEPDPLTWLLVEEQRELVRQVLDALPPRDAEILLLKYTEDWKYRQLAEHLGISVSAVESRLHRAREKMRRELAKVSPELIPR